MGNLLDIVVHSANIQDRAGVKLLLTPESQKKFPSLSWICADKGYTGTGLKNIKEAGFRGEIITHTEDRQVYTLKEGEEAHLSK